MEMNFILSQMIVYLFIDIEVNIENYLIVKKSNCLLILLQCWTATERHNNACKQGTGD